MPRPRNKSSTVTALVVTPWRTAKRGKRSSGTLQREESIEESSDSQIRSGEAVGDSVPGLDDIKAEALRKALWKLVQAWPFAEDLSKKAFGLTNADGMLCGICVLVFEQSGGHFVGIVLKEESIAFHVTGTKLSDAFPDCKYTDGNELYKLDLKDSAEIEMQTEVCNNGGDFAKIQSENPDGLSFSFKCKALYANSSDCMIAPYFRDLDNAEEILVNVGVACISGTKTQGISF